MLSFVTYVSPPSWRERLRSYLEGRIPQPEVRATATNSSSLELLEAALADPATPPDQRAYLEDLRARKYT